MIDGLCKRWGCPPSAVLAEDATLVMAMLTAIKGGEQAPEQTDDEQRYALLSMRSERVG